MALCQEQSCWEAWLPFCLGGTPPLPGCGGRLGVSDCSSSHCARTHGIEARERSLADLLGRGSLNFLGFLGKKEMMAPAALLTLYDMAASAPSHPLSPWSRPVLPRSHQVSVKKLL